MTNTPANSAKSRSKPHQDRARQLAAWIDSELRSHADAERFAIIGERRTWEVIRLALRKYGK